LTGFEDRPSHITHNGERIPLWEHLDDVRQRVRAVVPAYARSPDDAPLVELTERVALVHDLGKLTEWFRQHLFDETAEGPTHHSRLGSLAAYYVLSTAGFDSEDALVGYVAVAKHHGRLPDTGDYVYEAMRATRGRHAAGRSEVKRQVTHIGDTVPELADEVFSTATDGAGSWDEFRQRVEDGSLFDSIVDHVGVGRINSYADPHPVSDEFYAGVLQVWSALVLADKTSAASLTGELDLGMDAYDPTRPQRKAIDNHVADLQRVAAESELSQREQQLNENRERARNDVRRRAREVATSDTSVATLTLPTGLGKTLTGLDAALTVQAERNTDSEGRIVYALPFTSIIDQVADVASNVFDVDHGDDLLTVHHHLADTVVEPEAPEEVADDDRARVAELLGESWQSGLVITTFIQFFESLAGPGNVQSMKLPSLYDSVVILDEPQALPHEWWPLVRRLVNMLTDEYRATVVAMTATQPHLLSTANGEEPPELVVDHKQYFETLDRVTFHLDLSAVSYLDDDPKPLEYNRAAAPIAESLRDENATLAVCNTIDSARQLVDELGNKLPEAMNVNEAYEEFLSESEEVTTGLEPSELVDRLLSGWRDDEPLVCHLTTRHRPCDRRRLLAIVSTLAKRGYSVGLVSTQLIEAGVDVSFDHVYRDFAPLDNLVQAAGRCNRSFDRDTGQVTVWFLAPPNGKQRPPSTAVYSGEDSLTKLTARALDQVREGTALSEEQMTLDAVRTYFGLLDDRDVGDPEYVDYVDNAKAESLGRQSLIDERLSLEVIVCRTSVETKRAKAIKPVWDRGAFDRVDELLDSLQPLRVSVPVYQPGSDTETKLRNLPPLSPDEHAEIRYLDTADNQFRDYFDATNGLDVPDSTVGARFL